jgi:hypothetical protein
MPALLLCKLCANRKEVVIHLLYLLGEYMAMLDDSPKDYVSLGVSHRKFPILGVITVSKWKYGWLQKWSIESDSFCHFLQFIFSL